MYKERYEMLKEAEKTGANISPIDYSFIDWYEKEAVKYTPQNTSSNSDYAKCANEICGYLRSALYVMEQDTAVIEILRKHFA